MWWKPQKRETTDVWPLASSLDFFSLFSLPSSSRLPQSLAGLPSCHIVLERVLNYVLSSCHPVFSPTIHPSIHPSIHPISPPAPQVSASPLGFLDGQYVDPYLSPCVSVSVCLYVFVCACFETVTNARLGFTGEQSRSSCRCCQDCAAPQAVFLSLSALSS